MSIDKRSKNRANFGVIPTEELEKEIQQNKLHTYGGDLSVLLEGSHIIYSSIEIGGEEVLKESNFTIAIKQKVAEHDSFEIICPSEAFGERDAYPLTHTRTYLGKRATIQFKQFSQVTYIFTGIITHISNKKIDGYSHVILKGQSPTILMENGLDCQSYENKDLTGIIKTATSEYPSDVLEFDIAPNLKQSLLYTVQYKESDYNFIKRLATRYGEWFYYNGQQVVFGGYGGKTVELVEEQDVFEFELKMQLVPQKFTYISNDNKQAKDHIVNSESVFIEPSVNPFQQHAIEASEKVFTKTPSSFYNQSLMENGEMELKEAVKRQRQSKQNVFFLEAKSRNPNIRLGDIVKLKAWMPGHEIFKNGEVPLESYRIVEINHYQEGISGYYNEFVGIPKDVVSPYYMNEDALPESEEQAAVITDNADSEGLGRVRVQFSWQKSINEKTPWIGLLQPHSGGGKGFHFLPEIGEEVLVGFENNNAEKPFVLGTRYNGREKTGFLSKNNDIKTIKSRAGHTLLFYDGNNPSITLHDRDNNVLHINTNAGSINISSNKKVFICSDNIEVTARENLALSGDTLSINAGKQLNINSPDIQYNADKIAFNCDDLEVNAYNEIKMKSEEDTVFENKNLTVTTEEKIKQEAKEEINLSTQKIKNQKI